jgi:hypothetical protein
MCSELCVRVCGPSHEPEQAARFTLRWARVARHADVINPLKTERTCFI